MNRQAEITLDFGDGSYLFKLTVAGTIELEEKCGAPITVVFRRIEAGEYMRRDLRETIRLGLIGGGLKPPEALKLVTRYVDERPITECWPTARFILAAAMFGFAEDAKQEDDDAGKAEAAPATAPNVSTPPPSTEHVPSSASPSKPYQGSRYGNFQQP